MDWPDLVRRTPLPRGTPLGAAGRGIASGMGGALVFSLLARALPGMRDDRRPITDIGASTLAPALTIPQSPGPEGMAEQFAYKVAAGLFGRDLSAHPRLAGRLVHVAYGGAWGMLYGLWQGSYPQPPVVAGPIYGTLVWAVGPATLVPAMRLVDPPSELPPRRLGALVAGHVGYGIALAVAFGALQGKDRS